MRLISIVTLCCIILTIFALDCAAATYTKLPGINLQCYYNTLNFQKLDSGFANKNISLRGVKNGKFGSKRVFEIDRYEFWVFTYVVTEHSEGSLISSIQVGIKNSETGDFFHSSSNNRGQNEMDLLKAEIRLIEYYPDSFLDKGHLTFGCDSYRDA